MSGDTTGTRVTPGGWTVADRGGDVVCVATSTARPYRESTFIKDHMARLPATVTVLAGLNPPPRSDSGEPVSPGLRERLVRAVLRRLSGRPLTTAQDVAIARHLRRRRVCVVLAEFGPTAHSLVAACRIARLPLVAHFHGYDVSVDAVIREYGGYASVFMNAAAVVAVSRDMHARLLAMGARPETLHDNAYGVDTRVFAGGEPSRHGPVFLAVGRFVEKKAPEVTLLAFRQLREHVPAARLVMIGDGPLRGSTQRVCRALGLAEAVTFMDPCSREVVAQQLRGARAFVQHSLRARDGDSEGTPVAVIEASSTGLPVVATRHAGIPDVVVEGETGYLVDEEDVCGMADRMRRLAERPELAARLGAAGRRRAEALFSMERSIGNLWAILQAARGQRT